jgi:hypothetical protein
MKFSKPKASYQLNNQPEQKKNHIKLKKFTIDQKNQNRLRNNNRTEIYND